MDINASNLHFKELNDTIKNSPDNIINIKNCLGQRYIGSGVSNKDILIRGIPGNALGSYLDGANITVMSNVQDAVGDTMNSGNIYIHGSSGDATGYAMRGGSIFVKGNAGYRAGIHMKSYEEKLPVLVIGGSAGSFLGEYQSGGIIIILGIDAINDPPVGFFCSTGMYGGKVYLRCNNIPVDLPSQVVAKVADETDMKEANEYITEFCKEFNYNTEEILEHNFYVLTPDSENQYLQLYINN